VPSLDTIRDNVSTYSDWFELQSVARAKVFVTWATRYLMEHPSSAAQGPNSAGFRIDLLEKQLDEARKFVAKHDTGATSIIGPNVTKTDFRRFRRAGL